MRAASRVAVAWWSASCHNHYFTLSPDGAMDEWDELPDTTPSVHDHTAREADTDEKASVPFRVPRALATALSTGDHHATRLSPGERGDVSLEGSGCISRAKESFRIVSDSDGTSFSEYFQGGTILRLTDQCWTAWLARLVQALEAAPYTRREALGISASKPVPDHPLHWSSAGTGSVELQIPCACGTLTYHESGGQTDRPVRVARLILELFADHGVLLDLDVTPVGVVAPGETDDDVLGDTCDTIEIPSIP